MTGAAPKRPPFFIGRAIIDSEMRWTFFKTRLRLRILEAKMDELNKAIGDLNAAVAALQGRTAGSVPLAAVQAAAVQIEAAVATLNGVAA